MRFLIMEETLSAAKLLHTFTKKEHCHLDILDDVFAVCDYIALNIYDLLILDISASPKNCFCLIQDIRKKHYQLPILVLSQQHLSAQCTDFLNAGADYYLAIGSNSQELTACVRSLLRRSGSQHNELSFGNTALALSSATLSCRQKSVRLTAKEFDMMRLLMQNPSYNISKETLLSYIWGYDSDATENHVEVYIGFLRKKLKTIQSDISILSVRKLGYHLELLP